MAARILVTIDGSALAERAVPVAAALAQAAGATLDVLCVADEAPIQTVENRDAEHALAVAQQAASVVARALRTQGVSAEGVAVVDRPADGILRYAAARHHRLLVMATHGRGGLGRALHGSVAAAVVRGSRVPVVLVRAWEDGVARQPPDGTPTLLVPLDGSELAEAALPLAHGLAELLRGELILVRALQMPISVAGAVSAPGGLVDPTPILDAERDEATAYLSARAAALPSGGPVTTTVETGPAADVIAAVAVARHATLVVMATHGRGGLLQTLFGSTTERVVRFGPCPVAVVRPDAASAS
jgi:nucleotide-binding universal stress UspA family protein